MITWTTDRGRTVSAVSRADAERLAAQYGLGSITGRGEIARPKKEIPHVVWDDLCQTVRCEGSRAECEAYAASDGPGAPYIIMPRSRLYGRSRR